MVRGRVCGEGGGKQCEYYNDGVQWGGGALNSPIFVGNFSVHGPKLYTKV